MAIADHSCPLSVASDAMGLDILNSMAQTWHFLFSNTSLHFLAAPTFSFCLAHPAKPTIPPNTPVSNPQTLRRSNTNPKTIEPDTISSRCSSTSMSAGISHRRPINRRRSTPLGLKPLNCCQILRRVLLLCINDLEFTSM